ncbi:MAG: VOC family protein [Candidatus Heimdallarchaeota archaeon]|nr:MAG: VOC family protein [Candidatus Heimdallarchaeota archaeon]
MTELLENQVIIQIGLVVENIERTADFYSKIFGIEKPDWFWTESYESAKTMYKDKPTQAIAKLMFFKFGQVELELIEPDEKPSTWREHLDKYGEGVHHIAFVVDNIEQKVKKLRDLGIPLSQKGEFEGGRYAYIDTFKELKVLLELLELES